MPPSLRERVRTLPACPGVYLFKDAQGRVLYVGKARSLKARVSSYFDTGRLEPGKRDMMRHAADAEIIMTNNETEALALEASLIQQHQPPYNIRLVDDASYLYVRISRETYPQTELVRTVAPDSAWYRGPFPTASAIRRTLKEARKLFPWCSLKDPGASGGKPCFAYHLGLCSGICTGVITVEEYHRIIEGLKRFLDGDVREAIHLLRQQMVEASRKQAYERAARFRDALHAIEKATVPQHAVTPRRESMDVLGLSQRGPHAVVAILSVREGRITNARLFTLLTPTDTSAASLIRSFLLAYLPRATDSARELILPKPVKDVRLLERLATRETPAGQPSVSTSLRISVPQRGWKRRLLELARANAEQALAQTYAELESPAALTAALKALAETLHLPRLPHRIETYDISNIQGALATGSMVVFIDGKPRRSAYRKFKIRADGAPNDVAMMREVLSRRFGRYPQLSTGDRVQETGFRRRAGIAPPSDTRQAARDEWPLPDLVILDGGKPQLAAGLAVLKKLGLPMPLAALAKREEELFVLDRVQGTGFRGQGSEERRRERFRLIRLERTSPALYLLQRMRDESHRVTLGYHQLLRKKYQTRSALEEIPDVGPRTRKKLLRVFGSLRGIRAASPEELSAVVGPARAHAIHTFLRTGHPRIEEGVRSNEPSA